MNQVVNFLSLLAVTEEQGGIKRMLGVCVEFERIAKVVLDRAEKETHSRRKRKSNVGVDENKQDRSESAPKLSTPLTPTSQNQQPSPNSFSPSLSGDLNQQQAFNPNFNAFSPIMNNGNAAMPLDFAGILNPPATMQPVVSENDFYQFPSGGGVSPLNIDSFEQQFVPQDLWQIPQTLEWDWADLNNLALPTFDGNFGQNQHSSDGYAGT